MPRFTAHDFLKPGFRVNDENRTDFKAWIQRGSFTGETPEHAAPPPGTPGPDGKPFVPHAMVTKEIKPGKYVHKPLYDGPTTDYETVIVRLLREKQSYTLLWAASNPEAREIAKRHGIKLPAVKKVKV